MVEGSAPGRSGPLGLTLGARQLLDGAAAAHGGDPGPTGWLIALLERNGPLAEALAPGLDAAEKLAELRASPARDMEAIADRSELIARAGAHAAARARPAISEIDLGAVLLAGAGCSVLPPTEIGRLHRAGARTAVAVATGPTSGVVATPGASAPAEGPGQAAGVPTVPAAAPAYVWRPVADKPTPTLDQYGRDLTKQASEGRLGPVVGRENECEQVIETLCRRQKRNPVLLGEAGTGKTAIVEGLAARVVTGRVAPALQGVRIVQLQPSSLVAGAAMVGELENRMKAILEEARQDGIILFFDEVHSIVGTGGMRGTGDLASLLKPALARGEIACIAATTDDEYRRFIAEDAALERRFNPVPVTELDRPSTLAVLRAHRDALERLRGVRVSDELLDWLIGFSIDALPNRRLPDKAVDLLEQCVAHAVVQGEKTVDRLSAEDVVRRMVGVPLSVVERVDSLRRELEARGLSNPAATRTLTDRLLVTMRGLDSRRRHPNAVVLVTGSAGARAREIADTIATTLFGGGDRLVEIELGRMTNPHDISMLVGAPPGYIGYSDRLPIHRIAAMPWCVVLCVGVDAAHPEIREILAEAIEDGAFVDGAGRRIPLSDVVVVLAGGAAETVRPVGFRVPGAASDRAAEIAPDAVRRGTRILGERLARLVDVVIDENVAAVEAVRGADRVLARLAERLAGEGATVAWDPSVATWLSALAGPGGDLDAVADRELLPQLVRVLGEPGGTGRRIRVAVGPGGAVSATDEPGSGEGEAPTGAGQAG